MSKVNLDALIPREDFEIDTNGNAQNLADRLKVSELVKGQGFFYSSLRKPDFQRETSGWDSEKIVSFIKSFIDGDLIPSIILWQAGQYTFVIDGAHRLSALIAWVNNDYGDGFISQAFFNHDIDTEQIKFSKQTQKAVASSKDIKPYQFYMDAIANPDMANPDVLRQANKLGFLSLQLQWVTGNSKKAEDSFFIINQKATPISDTEIELLKSRRKPYAMASRAILRAGTGHQYWKDFALDNQEQIIALAKDINESLFTPEIKVPIKTLDLPLAGKGYSSNALPLVFDLVKLSNDLIYKDGDTQDDVDDIDGSKTIAFLKKTQKMIRRLTTTHQSSLGLHPAVYFYSDRGRYQPSALMAWIEFVKHLEAKKLFNTFTQRRELFENFLVENKFITNQVSGKYGSGLKSYRKLKEVYLYIFNLLENPISFDDIKVNLKKNYPYLNFDQNKFEALSSDFNREAKSEVFLTQALEKAYRCEICKGYIHVNSITIDHIERKQDGGKGHAENGQITHPYCNSTFKN